MRQIGKAVAVYTLGRFALVVDGREVAFAGRAPHKPIELLQALIALGGRAVNCMVLASTVWPEDDSDDPRNLFDNTLFRLRRLLGHRDAVVMGDSRLSLNAQQCWVDTWDFDRLAARHFDDGDDAAAAQALGLYQGHFLEREAPQAWACGYRERMHGRVLRLLLSEGGRLEAQGRWDGAADWYARGLEIDPLDEALRQRLVACRRMHGAGLVAGQGLRAIHGTSIPAATP